MKTLKITEITFNYSPATSDGREVFGEEFTTSRTGHNDVIKITENYSKWEGDRVSYDVEYATGQIVRVYNPNIVTFSVIEA